MTDHLIDIAADGAYLRVQYEQLVIERKDQQPASVSLAEVAALILAHPQAVCTLSVLAGLMEKGGAVVACDRRNLPVGLMLPLQAHSTQTERFAAQAAASLPTHKRLWKQIVAAKVRAQAALLADLRGDDFGLTGLAARVRSGDPDNIEAQAARRYWPALFDDPAFHRRHDADDQNRLLNYGYAVLRAIVGRAVCAVGLHPSLGLHHHNRYDPFCLAADLMEPYRPLVDQAVVQYVATFGKDAPLDRQAKQALLAALAERYRCQDQVRTLFDLVARTASSLAKVFLREGEDLFFPERIEHAGE